jgi:hypothetical protein
MMEGDEGMKEIRDGNRGSLEGMYERKKNFPQRLIL